MYSIIDVCPTFIHFITESLNLKHLETTFSNKSHNCCHRSFINDDDRQDYMDEVTKYGKGLLEYDVKGHHIVIKKLHESHSEIDFTEEEVEILKKT